MPDTKVIVHVPGNHLMAGLLGPRDELLRLVEDAFPDTDVHVRGNEITVDGRDAEQVGRLFEELVVLLQQGQALEPAAVRRTIDMVQGRRAPVRGAHRRGAARRPRAARSGPRPAARSATSTPSRDNVITFGVGPAGTGKSWLAVAMAVQALQAKEVDRIILTRPAVEAGERLGFLPGDLMAKVDPYLRPLYDALYDMVEPEGAPAPARAGHGRGRAAGLHARPHAQQQLHHPRRGPEHHARADEDVPHPHRLRLQGRHHRRHHPGRRARRPQRPRSASSRCSAGIDGLGVRAPHRPRRRAPPHRAGHRRRLRAGDAAAGTADASRRQTVIRPDPAAGAPAPAPRPTTATSTVFVADEQADHPVDVDRWQAAGRAACSPPRASSGEAELSLLFVDEADHRRAQRASSWATTGPTDVLSFPIDGDDVDRSAAGPTASHQRPRPRAADSTTCPLLLGDVVVCPAVAAAQRARATPAPTTTSSPCCVVHGILHLLGHDHAEPDDDRRPCRPASASCSTGSTGPARRRPVGRRRPPAVPTADGTPRRAGGRPIVLGTDR